MRQEGLTIAAIGPLMIVCLLVPLVAALVGALVPLPRRAIGLLGAGSILVSFIFALLGLLQVGIGSAPSAGGTDVPLFTWVAGGGLAITAGLWVDGLSLVFALVITGVGFLIHVYSLAYMQDEEQADYGRYFSGMNFFVGAMLLLVLADSFPLLLVGWAGVGFASYLLIGFWYGRPEAVVAARKAFILNTVGDVALILAIALMFRSFGSGSFASVLGLGQAAQYGGLTAVPYVWIGLLLFLAAAAKSAQLPLQSWLSDAMEGPTPVSALIHAATMVTAGVYLIARCQPIFGASAAAAGWAGYLGAITALAAASVGIFSYDIKRLLAYSTMSQVGYMVTGVAFGAVAAGVSHVVMHAFLKALLFMCVGLVMHACGDERDMRRFGGLAQRLPLARWGFLIGALALAGIPPFAGFWSKDAIMGALLSGHVVAYVLLALAALATPFYIFRAYYLTFAGSHRGKSVHPHDQAALAWPTVVLGVLSVLGGGLALAVQSAWGLGFDWTSAVISTVLALIGWGLAWRLYRSGDLAADLWTTSRIGDLVRREYGWEALWQGGLVGPTHAVSAWVLAAWEGRAWPAGEAGLRAGTTYLGRGLALWQSGWLRRYGLTMFAGAAALLLYALVVAR